MNKVQALHSFWASFDVPAIDEISAYDLKDAEVQALGDTYITYEVATDEIESPAALSGSIWDRSTSWATATEKAEEISQYIGLGGRLIPYEGGAIWITRGTPFAQRTVVEEDYDFRRITLSINAEFLSA